MSTVKGRSRAATTGEAVVPSVATPGRRIFGVEVQAIREPQRIVFALPLTGAAVGLLVGGAALLADRADVLSVPALVVLFLGLLAAIAHRARTAGVPGRALLILAALCLGAIALLASLPEWTFGAQINAVIHRSAISSPLLLLLSAFTAAYALRGLLGSTPSGDDLSLYPVLALPIVLALIAYGLILGRVVASGLDKLSLSLLTTAWREQLVDQNGAARFLYDVGLRNNILGTVELIALTSLIAILPGVGAGIFMSEYPGPVARLVDFSTTMLRAVSVFVIGAVAFSLVTAAQGLAPGSLLSDLIRGVYHDAHGLAHPGTGSFLTASIFLALLVIPMIAKLTEAGLRSVPRDIREGSVALGATDGYGLRRILLPWASLNIVTALLLGAAEASGSLAVIMFIAGVGQDGVAPTNSVTSLDYALFATRYGLKPYVDTMAAYRFATALLLLILTLGLTVAALFVRRRFAQRYRGTLTAD